MKKVRIGVVFFCSVLCLAGWSSAQAQVRIADPPTRGAVVPAPSKLGEGPAATPRSLPVTAAPKTDLAVGEFNLSQERPGLGDTIEVQVSIQNLGEIDFREAKVQLFSGRRLLGEQSIRLIRSKAQEKVRFSFKADNSGSQTLRVVVNADGLASETNQANNTLQKVIEVLPPPTAQMKGGPPASSTASLKMASGPGAALPPGKVLYDTLTPNLIAKVESAIIQGQKSTVTLKISNQGTGPALPFKVGIFTASPGGGPEGTPIAKGAVPAPLGPGADYPLKISLPSGLIFLANQKFVAVVDVDNEIQEGAAGEKDNVTPPFTLTQAGSIIVEPFAISDFKVLNPSLLPGEQPNVYGAILGGPVVSWQVSYKYPDGKEFIAHYEKAPFPALKSFGDYVPIPFPVWHKGGAVGPGAKAKIILAASKGGGQVVKKEAEVTLASGAAFDGSMNIAGVNWKLNGPKLESVTVNVSYTANNDFTIGDYGHPLYGSVWVSLEKSLAFGDMGISSSKISLGVCSPKSGNLDYPKTIIKKGSGNITLKCLPPSAEIKGLLEYANVWKEAQGIGTRVTELVCKSCDFYYPSLRVGLNFVTPSGVKGVFKEVEIKDAFLDKKNLTFWQEDIGVTGYICTPCPPGY